MALPASEPAVRRRPRDRKARIVRAAARLFWERGYHQVSMSDIAGEVDIGASALYRHFRGKADLFASVLDDGLDQLDQAAGVPGGLDELLTAIAGAVLDRREYAALWDRAGRQLETTEYRALHARRRVIRGRIADAVTRCRPRGAAQARLHTLAVVAVLESPSWHRIELDRDSLVGLLVTAASAMLRVELPEPAEPGEPETTRAPLLPVSRREALLAAASTLFAERGFASVSLDDVGAAIGIAGPSVYNHFASKGDLLLSALNRGNEALWFALHQVLASAEGPADALGRLLDSYLRIIVDSPEIISVLVSQVGSLPAERRVEFHRVQQEYVAEWVALLRRSRTELDERQARVLVHAALALANSLAGGQRLPSQPLLVTHLGLLGRAVLGLG